MKETKKEEVFEMFEVFAEALKKIKEAIFKEKIDKKQFFLWAEELKTGPEEVIRVILDELQKEIDEHGESLGEEINAQVYMAYLDGLYKGIEIIETTISNSIRKEEGE